MPYKVQTVDDLVALGESDQGRTESIESALNHLEEAGWDLHTALPHQTGPHNLNQKSLFIFYRETPERRSTKVKRL